ncbi:MAG: hypothetical protein JWQ90_1218 [Hydrocarboniphaga sp.]|nr:hypothetical protein [Hydrocarboniphaga sp.]
MGHDPVAGRDPNVTTLGRKSPLPLAGEGGAERRVRGFFPPNSPSSAPSGHLLPQAGEGTATLKVVPLRSQPARSAQGSWRAPCSLRTCSRTLNPCVGWDGAKRNPSTAARIQRWVSAALLPSLRVGRALGSWKGSRAAGGEGLRLFRHQVSAILLVNRAPPRRPAMSALRSPETRATSAGAAAGACRRGLSASPWFQSLSIAAAAFRSARHSPPGRTARG